MKTALITGANKGIGYAIAEQLIKRDWHVLVGARSKERGLAAVAQLNKVGPGLAEWLEVDLSDLSKIDVTIQAVKSGAARLELLINNAGIPGDMSVASYDSEVADVVSTVQVNYIGTFALTKGLVPVLHANQGRIVNITVPTSVNPYWNPMAYKASKAAQNAMMEHMALDFDNNNIPIETFSIHPGPTTTDLNGNMSLPGFHTPEEVAVKTIDLLFDGKRHQGETIEIYPIVAE
jgi:NAD(P)-dependent dehydrogenase (short-subunit alcohol dehydrogenase family)